MLLARHSLSSFIHTHALSSGSLLNLWHPLENEPRRARLADHSPGKMASKLGAILNRAGGSINYLWVTLKTRGNVDAYAQQV
jgi:hypothetical protein